MQPTPAKGKLLRPGKRKSMAAMETLTTKKTSNIEESEGNSIELSRRPRSPSSDCDFADNADTSASSSISRTTTSSGEGTSTAKTADEDVD